MITRMFVISTRDVLTWIKIFALKNAQKPMPDNTDVGMVARDEM